MYFKKFIILLVWKGWAWCTKQWYDTNPDIVYLGYFIICPLFFLIKNYKIEHCWSCCFFYELSFKICHWFKASLGSIWAGTVVLIHDWGDARQSKEEERHLRKKILGQWHVILYVHVPKWVKFRLSRAPYACSSFILNFIPQWKTIF